MAQITEQACNACVILLFIKFNIKNKKCQIKEALLKTMKKPQPLSQRWKAWTNTNSQILSFIYLSALTFPLLSPCSFHSAYLSTHMPKPSALSGHITSLENISTQILLSSCSVTLTETIIFFLSFLKANQPISRSGCIISSPGDYHKGYLQVV